MNFEPARPIDPRVLVRSDDGQTRGPSPLYEPFKLWAEMRISAPLVAGDDPPAVARYDGTLDAARYAAFAAGIVENVAKSLAIPPAILHSSERTSYSASRATLAAMIEHEKRLQECFDAMIAASGFATMIFGEVFRNLVKLATAAYLAEFGRLPGSLRTVRLRKKRITRVLRWYLGGRR